MKCKRCDMSLNFSHCFDVEISDWELDRYGNKNYARVIYLEEVLCYDCVMAIKDIVTRAVNGIEKRSVSE